jgi:hypothetical protein
LLTLPGSSIEEPGGGEESAVHGTKGGARHEYWHNPCHLHVGVARVSRGIKGKTRERVGWGGGDYTLGYSDYDVFLRKL